MAAGALLAGLGWAAVLAIWFILGIGNGLVLTPSGRLLRRSAQPGDRPSLFAAQFALSHACWLVTYPMAGWLGGSIGSVATFAVLAAVTALGTVLAALLWPRADTTEVEHTHTALDPAHPHLAHAEKLPGEGYRHRHALVIDELHRRWPA